MQSKSEQQHSQAETQPRRQITTVQRKNQTLLRINADDYSTKHMVIFWVFYIGLIISISLLTLALPPTFITFSNRQMLAGTQLQGCPNPVGFDSNNMVYCNPITNTNPTAGLLLRQMSNKNQFFFVYVNFILENKAQSVIDIGPVNITLQYYELELQVSPQGLKFTKETELQNQDVLFSLKSYEAERIYENNGYSLRGYKKYFGYQKYVEEENSLIHFTFKNWPITNVREVLMEVTTVTPAFTIFSIVFRYVLFAISIATSIGYYLRYRLIPKHMLTLQQKMVMYLSIFTVLFNDPLYAATILAPNGFTAFCSVAFIVNFLTFLIAFWMIFIDRILYESGQDYDNVINKKKIVYFVLFYISLFVLEFQVALVRFGDSPMIIGDDMKTGGIIAFEVISFIIFAAGLIYIAVQYVRSAMNFFNKIWRNQMFLLFSFIFIIVIVVMLIIDGFSVYEYTGNRILILFGFMNMYTIYLQYMYSINTAEAERLDKQKIIGSGEFNRNEVQTIVSNFGGEQIMVDLDSQLSDAGQYYNQPNNPNRVNKYSQNINQRVQSRDEIEEQTMDNLNQKKQDPKQQDLYSVED